MFWIVIKPFSFENYIYTNSFQKQNDIKNIVSLQPWSTMQSLFSLAEIMFITSLSLNAYTKTFTFQHKGVLINFGRAENKINVKSVICISTGRKHFYNR